MTYNYAEILDAERDIVLLNDVQLANNFLSRARGLLFRKRLNETQGLLLLNCNSIHMLAMSFAIDVIFITNNGCVCKCISALKPWSFAKSRHAKNTLELRQGMINKLGILPGMKLEYRRL